MRRISLARVAAPLVAFVAFPLPAESLAERYAPLGTMIVTASANAMFPHASRESGYAYQGKTYPANAHYGDRTIAIFVPKGFRPGETTDLVFYFHGWNNSVEGTLMQFRVVEQLVASGVNAVLVLPEGPKNAPDSAGGRLEEEGAFASLVGDVLNTLKENGFTSSGKIGSIVLAGHSGAFRVISFILLRGGLTSSVREVYLFDALYGQAEKYAYWVDRFPGRLVAIHTADGGTRAQTLEFMDDLRAWGIPFRAVPESAATAEVLRKERLCFIESPLAHDDVVAARGQLRTYLETGTLSRR